MNYELILSDELLLVSDEKPQIGDWCIEYQKGDTKGEIHFINGEYVLAPEIQEKLLAGTPSLPKITFSEEAYKEMKERFGWVDVEREARTNKEIVNHSKSSFIPAFIEGFKLCQSINKNRFSEEDMVAISQFTKTFSENTPATNIFEHYKQQRQSKRVKVEVETLPNTIKITRLC